MRLDVFSYEGKSDDDDNTFIEVPAHIHDRSEYFLECSNDETIRKCNEGSYADQCLHMCCHVSEIEKCCSYVSHTESEEDICREDRHEMMEKDTYCFICCPPVIFYACLEEHHDENDHDHDRKCDEISP